MSKLAAEASEVAGNHPSRPVDLVAFDVDGTLVSHAHDKVIWHILFERFGGDAAIARQRYAAYMAGEITYAEWVDLDVGGFAASGATRAGIVAAVKEELFLSPDAREVVAELHRRDYQLAIISGTLDIVIDVLFPDHPFDHVFANRIEFADDGTIAAWQATPYDMDGKERGLAELAANAGITPERCAFVGDHINDLSALRLAGLAIAYDPKDAKVERAAELVLPAGELRQLLDLLP
jgi:phosphoserine phosphatase